VTPAARRVRVDVDAPVEVVFDYLADPANRPAWQSSLRRVVEISGAPGAGQRWTDVTWPGLRPAMATVAHERPRRWAERGTWHGVRADAELRFTERPGGCRVDATVMVAMPGPTAPLGPLLTRLAVLAMRSDLRRAAAILRSF